MSIEQTKAQEDTTLNLSTKDNVKLLLELAEYNDSILTSFVVKTDKSFQEINGRLDRIEKRFDKVESGIASVMHVVQEIKELLKG